MVLLHPVVAGRTRAAGKLRRGSGSLRRLPSGEVRSITIVPTRVAKKVINSELWHACAGPLVCLPQRGSLVYYFPQGHSEQVAATTNKTPNSRIPNYPSLPSQLLCQVHNITMHDTDEVYVQMTLQPVNSETDVFPIPSLGSYAKSKHPAEYFCKLKHRRGSWLHLLSGICNFSIWSLVSLVIMVVFLTLIDVACG